MDRVLSTMMWLACILYVLGVTDEKTGFSLYEAIINHLLFAR